MTIQNLQFFVEIAKDLNLTKTAERLFTTQQNLSSHIKRLEEEFNTVFVNRKPSVTLTKDGELLLETAQQIIEAEKQLRARLHTTDYPEKQLARVACYPWRMGNVIQEIMYEIYRRYPAAQIILVSPEDDRAIIAGPKTEHIESAFADRDIDFAIGTWGNDTVKLNAVPLFQSQSYFAVHRRCIEDYVEHAEAFLARSKDGLELKDIPADIPLIKMQHNGHTVPSALAYMGPHTFFHSNYVFLDDNTYDHAAYFCRKGQAGMFAPTLQLAKSFEGGADDVVFIPLLNNGEKIVLTYYLYYPSNLHLNRFQKFFISTVKEAYCAHHTDIEEELLTEK